MDFSFRRTSGETVAAFAGDAFVQAYLSHECRGEPFEIVSGNETVGALVTERGVMQAFFVKNERLPFAHAAFDCALSEFDVVRARTVTADSRFVSLCLGKTVKVTGIGKCFCAVSVSDANPHLRCAAYKDLPELSDMGFVKQARLEKLVDGKSVFVAEEGGEICGFATVEKCGAAVAVLNVYVKHNRRFNGIGSTALERLGSLCLDYRMTPVAFCKENDTAAVNTLKSAGYACCERIVEFEF